MTRGERSGYGQQPPAASSGARRTPKLASEVSFPLHPGRHPIKNLAFKWHCLLPHAAKAALLDWFTSEPNEPHNEY